MQTLNSRQMEAVVHYQGPLLILAGAGSGKTRVLVHRIVYLIEKYRVAPWNTLAVTFTNKAASEMKERIAGMLDPEIAGKITLGTFHSVCARVLRAEHERAGLVSSFTIADESEQLSRMKRAIKSTNLSGKPLEPGRCLDAISRAKNRRISPEEMIRTAEFDLMQKWTGQVYREYQTNLKEDQTVDFDDLILKVVELLEDNPDICEKYQTRYRFILVDEYQDTNHLQYCLVRILAQRYANLMVVGDDDQSIYRWRGAEVSNILNFQKDFPGTLVIRLEQNYRSTERILQAANALMSNNVRRAVKNLWTEKTGGEAIRLAIVENNYDEAKMVSEIIRDLHDREMRSYSDFAVFYRTNAQSRLFEENLRNSKIPYRVIGNVGFFKRKEVKDLLAYIRLVLNPFDSEACLRIINVPRRHIGRTTCEQISTIARDNHVDFFRGLEIAIQSKLLGSNKLAPVECFMNLIHDLIRSSRSRPLVDFIGELIKLTGYREQFGDGRDTQGSTSLDIIAEFEETVRDFATDGRAGIAELVDYLSLNEAVQHEDGSAPADPDTVRLLTIHNAKGLEFPVVIMTGMNDGLCPFYRSNEELTFEQLEEERRLAYVGMTRAQQRLFWIGYTSRQFQGKVMPQKPSRFFKEIPSECAVWLKKPMGPQSDRPGPGSQPGHALNVLPIPALPAAAKFKRGDRVNHGALGNGTILDIQGKDDACKVQISFDKHGVKKLILRLTQLRRLN